MKPNAAVGAGGITIRSSRTSCLRNEGAFTLIEVAVASAVLAIALFALIGVCAHAMRIARRLDMNHVDCTSLAAEFSLSNRVDEPDQSGDFGNLHPGYQWQTHSEEVGTNGLIQRDFIVFSSFDKQGTERHLSVYYYNPNIIRGNR
ncbi:MAG TPA: prepilin-type N-terminal cleavage/methylation domain-containing protein [Candidatus Limnocylindria bacterium]|nr:prepilin-type N-terminal cleavage/methylation domain-containing protein [Candidatus Limnocylindria bacterium]